MKTHSKNLKYAITAIVLTLLVLMTGFILASCGEKSLYNVDFSGNQAGEKYAVAATTWEKSEEEGFEAVYTLKGEVAYDKATADALGYTDGRVNFALIRITSDSVKRVEYDKETQKGFYCKITNFYGTDKESVVVKHGGFSSGNDTTKQTTYFLYQGVDNTVRTLTLEISFDGTEENARSFKFVIDPANYTLATENVA